MMYGISRIYDVPPPPKKSKKGGKGHFVEDEKPSSDWIRITWRSKECIRDSFGSGACERTDVPKIQQKNPKQIAYRQRLKPYLISVLRTEPWVVTFYENGKSRYEFFRELPEGLALPADWPLQHT